LRKKKIVEAVERGMPKIEAARAFGAGISSVKRYVASYREGRSLVPNKRPGSKPKLDGSARKLLEADLRERPTRPRWRRGASSCGEELAGGWRSATPRSPGCWGAPWVDLKKRSGPPHRAA
jgi:transposase